jgi:DNA-binding NtrC family response regulator
MADVVLISTHDLEPAVLLRDAFVAAEYDVELVTPGERVADVPGAALLILTGRMGEKSARRLAREATAAGISTIALFEHADEIAAAADGTIIAEAFIKPVDLGAVLTVGRRLVERVRLRRFTGIIGETDSMIEVLERVIQIAPVNSTVLITGESGTGKERVARGIHALSPRRHRPFIAANVAAMPETLLESELFGHEKGAFTGAIGQRKGFFELAHRGTLFLDELGEMPLATQAKLLRVLEERTFMRVGGESEISVDVRVIAATNQALRQQVEDGRFRRDLYHRLNVLSIHLPPLRERRADIPLLVDALIRQASQEHDRPGVTVSPEAMQMLVEAPWPGNVRELKNLVESMVVLSPGAVIRPEDIPPEIRAPQRSRALALVPADPQGQPGHGVRSPAASVPELEFIFRTILQLRIDMDDLRQQFEEYRVRRVELPSGAPIGSIGNPWGQPLGQPLGQPVGPPAAHPFGTDLGMHRATPHGRAAGSVGVVHPPSIIRDVEAAPADDEPDDEPGVVVYRPGMTLADLEAAAITSALRQVGGNRRKAADMLGMGERTLYRKIKEYGIPI